MTRIRSGLALAAAAAATVALMVPATAAAKPKFVGLVLAGPHPFGFQQEVPEALQKVVEFNDFFPHAVTIHVGDALALNDATGFHDFDIPARGQKPLPLITPAAAPVSGASDAAGNPFWFNGQPQLGFNPALTQSNWGKTLVYNGKSRVLSGLPPIGSNAKNFVVKFTKVGTVTYYCDVHPGMKGVIRVLPKKAKAEKFNDVIKAAGKQVAADAKIAEALSKTTAPAGTVLLGAAGKGGVEYLGMIGPSGTIAAGTTLSFQMSASSFESHTATFGPGNPEADPSSYLGMLGATFEQTGALDPIATHPSDTPGTTPSLTSSSHGNGFWNSGVLDASPTTPLPATSSLRFDASGTYDFYCLIHEQMHGTITVQ